MKNVLKILLNLFLTIAINCYPYSINALPNNWVEVPPSKYGHQLWDQNSIKINLDGSLRVLSKFIPNKKSEITEEIFYTMDINCIERNYRDAKLGSKESDQFESINPEWQLPNGDKLITGVIEEVCSYGKNTFGTD